MEHPVHRRFTKEVKLRIVRLASACAMHGLIGSLRRRTWLYESQFESFRRQLAVLCSVYIQTSTT